MAERSRALHAGLVATLLGVCLLQAAALSVAQDPADPAETTAGTPPIIDPATAKAMGVELEFDTPPKPKKVTRPNYPKGAFKKGIEGTVLVELVIDREGHVRQARVLKSVPELDDAALKCVKGWRFAAAVKNGEPVATIAHVPVMFKIKVRGAAAEPQQPHP
jgi:protein TonB